MAAHDTSKGFQEKRQSINNEASLWGQLTLSQEHAANGLNQLGYDLVFLRNYNTVKTAFMTNGDKVATVDVLGSIDISPDITIR